MSGGIAPIGSSFDPLGGYPADVPAGFDPLNEGFAGIILAQSQVTGATLLMYCIDIRTSTWPGLGYVNGTWDQSNVPNVGYVARVLNDFTPRPGAGGRAERERPRRGRAGGDLVLHRQVVLAAGDPVRDLTAEIVAAVIAAGPLVEPPPPNLTIDPAVSSGPSGSLQGPFTITADVGATITVTVAGGSMFADAAGTIPIPGGATALTGQQIWLQAASPGAGVVTFNGKGTVTAPTGNVYLYDGNTPGVEDAQRLILAQPAQVSTYVSAQAQFFDTGSLVVSKTIAGPAAGTQGQIVIDVTCNDIALDPFVIPAGSTGAQSRTYTGIPTPATCVITEAADGSNSVATVVTVKGSQQVELPQNTTDDDPVTAETITDTYDPVPGSLVVTKTIAGSAAGQQGPITVRVACDNGLQQDIAIPAGAVGDTAATIDGLPAGTVCTISEPISGATSTAAVALTPAGSVTVPAGGQATAHLTNTITPIDPTPSPTPEPPLAATGTSIPASAAIVAALVLLAAGSLLQLARRR